MNPMPEPAPVPTPPGRPPDARWRSGQTFGRMRWPSTGGFGTGRGNPRPTTGRRRRRRRRPKIRRGSPAPTPSEWVGVIGYPGSGDRGGVHQPTGHTGPSRSSRRPWARGVVLAPGFSVFRQPLGSGVSACRHLPHGWPGAEWGAQTPPQRKGPAGPSRQNRVGFCRVEPTPPSQAQTGRQGFVLLVPAAVYNLGSAVRPRRAALPPCHRANSPDWQGLGHAFPDHPRPGPAAAPNPHFYLTRAPRLSTPQRSISLCGCPDQTAHAIRHSGRPDEAPPPAEPADRPPSHSSPLRPRRQAMRLVQPVCLGRARGYPPLARPSPGARARVPNNFPSSRRGRPRDREHRAGRSAGEGTQNTTRCRPPGSLWLAAALLTLRVGRCGHAAGAVCRRLHGPSRCAGGSVGPACAPEVRSAARACGHRPGSLETTRVLGRIFGAVCSGRHGRFGMGGGRRVSGADPPSVGSQAPRAHQ